MDKLAVSVSPSVTVGLTQLTSTMIELVEDGWISSDPQILAADNYQALSDVAEQFALEVHDCLIQWKNFDSPCKVKITQQGLVNILAPQQRDKALVEQATHLLAFSNGSDDETHKLIESMKEANKKVIIVDLSE